MRCTPLTLSIISAVITGGMVSAAPAEKTFRYEVPHAWTRLQFPDCPVALAHTAEAVPRSVIALQRGLVHVLPVDRGSGEAPLFVDLREKLKTEIHFEGGLHSVIFHPGFTKNRRVFFSYSQSEPRRTVLSEMIVPEEEPFRADPATERIILEVPHQLADHYSGCLAFGPDGMLYWSIGDGGLRDDPLGMAQHPYLLQGKVLRLDVDHRSGSRAYSIPKDNPFVARQEWRGEIYALGFRNPWGMTFDPQTGALWLADVGQELYEEINVVRRGGNYGWGERDGPSRLLAKVDRPQTSGPYADPIYSYTHTSGDGICIVGGCVYRGKKMAALRGCYLYGDWGYGKIYALRPDAKLSQPDIVKLLYTRNESVERFNPTCITTDARGEPLVLNHSGWIHSLVVVADNVR